jgi:hypothetical protein
MASEGKMTDQQLAEIDDLRSRLARLESSARAPRGRTNLTGAARYLGRSDEWLRQQHLLGRGPRRKRNGTRGWDYTYAELDAYPDITEATP